MIDGESRSRNSHSLGDVVVVVAIKSIRWPLGSFLIRPVWFISTGKTRRFVEYKEPSLPDMHSIHILWYQWIRFQRPDPPTAQEVAKYDRDFMAFKARAKAVSSAFVSARSPLSSPRLRSDLFPVITGWCPPPKHRRTRGRPRPGCGRCSRGSSVVSWPWTLFCSSPIPSEPHHISFVVSPTLRRRRVGGRPHPRQLWRPGEPGQMGSRQQLRSEGPRISKEKVEPAATKSGRMHASVAWLIVAENNQVQPIHQKTFRSVELIGG